MASFFPKWIVPVLFVGVSACSSGLPFGGTQEKSRGEDANGRIKISPPEYAPATAKVLGDERLLGFVHFEVVEAEPVATDATGAQLGLAAGILAKGPAAGFREKAEIPQETMAAVDFLLPFTDGLSDNLVVLYRLLPEGDSAPVVGLIPLSYLKVDAAAGTVTFKPRGLGDYQVAHTPEKMVKPLTSSDGVPDPSVPVGNMSTLNLLGSMSLTGATGVDVNATHAFVVGDASTRVIDITNPQAMALVSLNGNSSAGRSAQLSGNVLVQAAGGGMSTLNVANPAAPVFRAGIDDATAGFTDLTIIGNYGFATNLTGLRQFAVTGNMLIAGDQLTQTGGCLAAAGDTRIAAFACAATVIGIVTSQLPLAAGFTIDNAVGGRGVAVSGNYVYVTGDDGLRIYDVTQPLTPRRVGSLNFAGGRSLAVVGNTLLVVNTTEARLVDVTNKAAPGFYNTNANLSLTGGRRVRMIPGTNRAVILDDAGLKYVEMR